MGKRKGILLKSWNSNILFSYLNLSPSQFLPSHWDFWTLNSPVFPVPLLSHMPWLISELSLTISFGCLWSWPLFYLPGKTENYDECSHSFLLLYLHSLVLLEGSMEGINWSHSRCAISEFSQAFTAGHQCFPLVSCFPLIIINVILTSSSCFPPGSDQ